MLGDVCTSFFPWVTPLLHSFLELLLRHQSLDLRENIMKSTIVGSDSYLIVKQTP